jgi:hypothetical protein
VSKRVSLSERRSQDKKGIDALIQPTGEPKRVDKPLVKATYYIRPEQVVAIESIQLEERQKTGKRKDKSELVQEALDLLFAKYHVKTTG